MSITPRLLDPSLNLVKASATVLSADSAQQANPLRYLLDQLRSKVWRSQYGWVIIAGWNDSVRFDPSGGELTATIAPGFYATGSEIATAFAAALDAIDPGGTTYAGSYDSTTGKITLTTNNGALTLYWTSALSTARRELGYDATDETGDIHVGDSAVYQSRHYLACDFGSALPITAAVLLDDNLSATATLKVQSSATSVLAALTAPTVTQTLTDQGDHWKAYFASQSHRYVVFLIDDVGNKVGYAEAGIACLGTYRQPAVAYSSDPYVEQGEDLSTVDRATEGANFGDERPEARAWTLSWDDITDADAAIFRAFRTATPRGKCFFFDFDPATTGGMVYGFRDSPLPLPQTSGVYWTPTFLFREALP